MSDLNPSLRRVLADIIERILPEYPPVDPGLKRSVHGDVTRYVESQISGMPAFLRLPYLLALLGFTWLPVLRYGRSFHGLSGERQSAYLALWSDAPIGAMRDFVKLIRSSALLVYFDHPLIMAILEAERHGTDTAQVVANG